MAFMSMKSYEEKHFGGLFLLRNDGDYADVIFMYRSEDDVLIADTHYVKTADYNGYVHCCQRDCPACGRGIRVQTKLFIPMYNITAGELQFWDRSVRFSAQLKRDVFDRYPNPADFVFRITRHGEAGSVDTTYEIVAVGRNSVKTYSDILVENNATMPAYYENVCKEYTPAQLYTQLNKSSGNTAMNGGSDVSGTTSSMPDYIANTIAPRASTLAAPTEADLAVLGVNEIDPLEEDVNF